jgi:hypothetical protein
MQKYKIFFKLLYKMYKIFVQKWLPGKNMVFSQCRMSFCVKKNKNYCNRK